VVIVVVTLFFVFTGSAKPPPGVPSDWKKYSANQLSIWLPPDYQVTYDPKEVDKLASNIKKPGTQLDALNKLVAMNPQAMVLSGLQPGPKEIGIVSTCNLITEDMPEGLNADDLMTSGTLETPAGFTIVDRSVVTLGKRNVGQIVLQGNTDTKFEQLEDIVYFIIIGDRVSPLTCGCDQNDFDRLEPVFQKVATNLNPS